MWLEMDLESPIVIKKKGAETSTLLFYFPNDSVNSSAEISTHPGQAKLWHTKCCCVRKSVELPHS
jgi:hypothetical protein